jgi:hypothetical protein
MNRTRTRYLISIGDLYLADPAPDDSGIRLTNNELTALKFVTFERACHVAKVAAARTELEPRVLSCEFSY